MERLLNWEDECFPPHTACLELMPLMDAVTMKDHRDNFFMERFETSSWQDIEAKAFSVKPLRDDDLHCEFIPTTVTDDCSRSL